MLIEVSGCVRCLFSDVLVSNHAITVSFIDMTLIPLDQHDPRLRQTCAPLARTVLRDKQQQLELDAILDFVFDGENRHEVGERKMHTPQTVGLSGNQVGIMKQICAVDLSVGHSGYHDVHLLVNPRITWWSKAIIGKPEGCVNFPGVWGLPFRSKSVRVSALDRSGNIIELKLEGWPAILLQHEVDHLYGRLFIDRLPDPSKAHLVPADEYHRYRQSGVEKWIKFVDVSRLAVPLPVGFQAGPHEHIKK